MSNLILPFSTFATVTDVMTPEECQLEIEALYQRQTAIAQLLAGTLQVDYVYDLLAEYGVNPHDWEDAVEENINYLITL
jgi:hypothetical protein